MKTLNKYLDLCKEKKELKNDSELANYLNISRASISIIRKGGGVSQKNAQKLAQGSKEPIEAIWLASLAQKEQNPVFKDALERISKLSGIASGFLLCFQSVTSIKGFKHAVECILC